MRSRPLILLLLITCFIAPAYAETEEETPLVQGEGSIYAYDEANPPAVFFFPADKARWDGTKVSIREWYTLSELQKQKFIAEYLDEMRKQYTSPIDVVSMDYLRALNMFSYFSGDKGAAEPTVTVMDKLLRGQGKLTPARAATLRAMEADRIATRISARTGDSITITLVSNPTTGYQWKLREPPDSSIIALTGSAYLPDATGLVGSGGREVYSFRAAGEGTARLTFVYLRPWEGLEKAAREAHFIIAIQEAAGAARK